MPAAAPRELPETPNAGIGDERREAGWGDLTVDYHAYPPHDLAPLLKGMPGDACPCPHWGYLFKGKILVHYADHDELIESGQAFYMAPGHAPEALEACELIQFSPTEPRREMVAIIRRNAAALRPPQ